MRNRCLVFLLVFTVVLNLQAAGDRDSESSGRIPVTRFIPGLAQLTSGKTVKGILLLGAFLGTVAGAIIENSRGNRYYDQYLASVDVDEIVALREKAESSFRSRNYYIAGICAVWLIHALDIKLGKSKKGVIKGEANGHSIHLGFYYFF